MVEIKKKPVPTKEWKSLSSTIELPEGVSAVYEDSHLTVKGPKGEIVKKLKYPRVKIVVEGNTLTISTEHFTQREKKIIFTYYAHVKNMITGVTEGFTYKLVVVYAKFPVTVECKDGLFTVKNLLGEKVPRTVEVPSDVSVDVKGKDIIVTGINKERVGQVAASIEQSTKINHFDRRVIQDGIYIVEKPHRKYV